MQYERKTMLCRLRKLKNKEAEETENAITSSIEHYLMNYGNQLPETTDWKMLNT